MNKMKKIYFETYGCSANFSDQEIMIGLLSKKYKIVDSPQKSDINIINTCVVKSPTENKMIYRIKELKKLNKPIVVAGCMPLINKKMIEKIDKNASMIGPNSIQKINYVVEKTLQGKKIIFLEHLKKPKLNLPKIRKNNLIEICQICSGCMSNCAYCCVKNARGRIFSYPPKLIIKEIKKSLKDGCKEIWITSQDNGCYGLEIKTNLSELLDKISKIKGNFFVRVGMINPTYIKFMLDDLIDAYKSDKIFKFLHIPVQSGSDKILNLMNRKYTAKEFKNIVKIFRKEFPFITISTDIIVGFPKETEKDFKQTINLIKEIEPDIVNISKFGARPNTQAEKMKQVKRDIINRRTKHLTKIVKKIQLKRNQIWKDWKGKILLDEIGKNDYLMGRNFAYKPIIVKLNKKYLGKIIDVRITKVKETYLIGEAS